MTRSAARAIRRRLRILAIAVIVFLVSWWWVVSVPVASNLLDGAGVLLLGVAACLIVTTAVSIIVLYAFDRNSNK